VRALYFVRPLYKLQEKPSAFKREHPALHNLNLFTFSLFSWIRIQPTKIKTDPCGSGSKTQCLLIWINAKVLLRYTHVCFCPWKGNLPSLSYYSAKPRPYLSELRVPPWPPSALSMWNAVTIAGRNLRQVMSFRASLKMVFA
jgi:hypothetical protein